MRERKMVFLRPKALQSTVINLPCSCSPVTKFNAILTSDVILLSDRSTWLILIQSQGLGVETISFFLGTLLGLLLARGRYNVQDFNNSSNRPSEIDDNYQRVILSVCFVRIHRKKLEWRLCCAKRNSRRIGSQFPLI